MTEGQVDPYNPSRDGKDLSSWLEHLRVLMPPRGIAHVGAGAGAELATYGQWTVPQLALIEADAALAKKLAEATKGREGWVVHPVLVDQTEGERSYFVASNPRESGLVPAEALHALWRNLRRTAERSLLAVTLDGLLAKGDEATGSDINWLVVDCLPAAAVLAGAQELLKRCDVVVARVALREDATAADGVTLKAATELLRGHGFEPVAEEEERMPLVGRALFVRKPGPVARNAVLQQDLLRQELSREREQHAALEAQQSALLEAQQRAALQAQQHTAALNAQLDEQAQRLAEAQRQYDVLRAGHDQARQSDAAAIEQLTALRSQLEAEHHPLRQELLRLQAEVGLLKTAAAEREHLIQELAAVRLQLAEAEQARVNQAQISGEQIAGAKSINLQIGAERNALLEFKTEAISKLMRLQTSLDESGELHQQAERRVAECEMALKASEERLRVRDDQFQSQAEALDDALRAAVEQKTLAARTELERQALESRLVLQRTFEIEMAKAEAQIALIRDVLLRQPEPDGSDSP